MDELVQQVRALDQEARQHKRSADRHRKAAQAARSKQAEIERKLSALGITVTYETGEGDFHGQQADPRPLNAG